MLPEHNMINHTWSPSADATPIPMRIIDYINGHPSVYGKVTMYAAHVNAYLVDETKRMTIMKFTTSPAEWEILLPDITEDLHKEGLEVFRTDHGPAGKDLKHYSLWIRRRY